MERERMSNGCYRLFFSDRELEEWGLDRSLLSDCSADSDAKLSAVLFLLCEQGEWPENGVCVEILPVQGGCFLLVEPEEESPTAPTPSGPAPSSLLSPEGPLVFSFDTVDALLDFGGALPPPRMAGSSLYAWEGRHYLIIYPLSGLPPAFLSRLCEWGSLCSGGKISAAAVTEHGTAVFVGDALQRLYQMH